MGGEEFADQPQGKENTTGRVLLNEMAGEN